MGGGGSYYDRDVTRGATSSSRGYSELASQKMSRASVNVAVLPKSRVLRTTAKSPLVFVFDVTGSMSDLPTIWFDKVPMVAGQLVMQEYLEDPSVSLAAVGDVLCDSAPVQVCDFCEPRKLDEWLQRLWRENGGGPGTKESYEYLAWYYANCVDMVNAQVPIIIFTGDEGYRETLSAAELAENFGGSQQSTNAQAVFTQLKKKFKNNVFMIFASCTETGAGGGDNLSRWKGLLGKENVIELKDKRAIADLVLGIIAIVAGSRTLDEYINDIRNRPLQMGSQKYEPQSEERIKSVRKSLESLAASRGSTGNSAQKPLRRKSTRQTQKPASDLDDDWKL